MGMMPYMHLGVVEKVLKRAKVKFEIGVVKVTYGQCEDMNDEKVSQSNSDQCEWNIFNGSINNVFHPVISEMGCKPHFLYRMMHLMKLPEKWASVQ